MEHGFAGHASKLYSEVVKAPLVFRGPGVAPGVDQRAAQLVDVAPSILGLLVLPCHPAFQGLDLFAPVFPEVRSRYSVAHTAPATQSAIERRGLKRIDDEELGPDVLFDLRADAAETLDLSVTNPSAAADLAWRLNVWQQVQLEYYANPDSMKTEYPPLVVDR